MSAAAMSRPPLMIINPFAQREEAQVLRNWNPRTDLGKALRAARHSLPEELYNELAARVARIAVFQSRLTGLLIPNGQIDPNAKGLYLGTLGERVITDAGVAYLATVMDASVAGGAIKYHAFGTGTTAEATGDTTLVTELTTEYATDNVRPTGSQSHSTNTYISTGTLAPDSGGTLAITEHGIASSATRAAATLWDRTKFAGAVNVVAAADSLAVTYTLTMTSGG